MNYQHILMIIENKLEGKFGYIIEDIRKRIASGSTGGEISSMVGKYLKELKFSNPIAYSLLEGDIQLYIHECKKHGLDII